MAREVYSFEVKEKGRSVLPAGLRSRCGFDVGVEVVAVPLGRGRAMLETREALLEDLWASQPTSEGEAVEDLRRMRADESAALLASGRAVMAVGVVDDTTEEDLEEFFASLEDG